MRYATLDVDGSPVLAVANEGGDWALFEHASLDMQTLIALGPTRSEVTDGALAGPLVVPADEARFIAPYRRTRKIWGIGLNYAEHAQDLAETRPPQPASFIKGDHTIIGPGEEIVLPADSARVTAEAELGLIIGRDCYRIDADEDPLDYVFGFVPILDQTAEDILQLNPRYLTRSKNYPTFFSFGPVVVSPDEALAGVGRLDDLVVSTVRNGTIVRSNTVSSMLFDPRELIRFHAGMMPLFSGDIISTGTPGAAVISAGDVVEARVGDLPVLQNRVVREVTRPSTRRAP